MNLLPKILRTSLARRLTLALLALLAVVGPWSWMRAQGSAPTNAPQVLLVVTNSMSMGGTTAGAIMTGSGVLASDRTSLQSYSSPVNYTVPAGFVPPLNTGSSGSAPYTVSCGGFLCDNGPSRMNLAKYAIQQVLSSYGNAVDFGIYTYSTATPALYITHQGYMSPSTGFTYTNTAASNTQLNPCYNYTASTTTQVYRDCLTIDGAYTANIGAYHYVTVSATADDPNINTVLHSSFGNSVMMFDSGVANSYWYTTVSGNPCTSDTLYNSSTSPPYSPADLYNYEIGSVFSCYSNTYAYGIASTSDTSITPSNAGYLPYQPQLMYLQRGFSEISNTVSATTGNVQVAMTNDATASAFTTALNPETNDVNSDEIKADARQSPIGGVLAGARSYLQGLNPSACQKQFVVLLTDGLPTLDLAGHKWPPLGSAAAAGYGVTASFNSDGTLNTTNDQALTDAMSSIRALKTAGIQVYVIGLGAGVSNSVNPTASATLQAMALAGGSSGYYPANSSAELNDAFLAIINQIYSASAVAAPVVPVSVAGGGSYEYTLTSNPVPAYGSVTAYAVGANGTPASSSSWEAAALMSASGRASALMSTKADGTTIAALSGIDTAAFSLSTSTCVPNVSTILSYTDNPSYTSGSCSYLAGRQSGSFLGTFSTQNSGSYVGPPANSNLVSQASYVSYANGLSGRTPMVLFSNNDGFLYGLNASTGALLWGWTPRSVLPQLQNYTTLQSQSVMNGGFTVVDAKDGATNGTGNWGSYVVGSARSGAEHFSLKLNSSGTPTTVVYDTTVTSGTAPGDAAPTVGSGASRQPPQIAWFNGSAYAIYVVNVGTSTVTSTLYEVNVATGASSSATLGFQPSSTLLFDAQASQLWVGSAAGGVYQLTISGSASSDVATAYQIGSTVSPTSSGTTVKPVLYVGYTQIAGVPYAYALDGAQITVFTVGSSGWTPLWAATPTSGYTYSASAFSASGTLAKMDSGAVISDIPLVVSGALLVPEYVAVTSGCGPGSGYIALFDLKTGKFPTITLSYQGSTVTASVLVGSGPAFTPSVTVTASAVAFNTGTASDTSPNSPMTTRGLLGPAVSGWRQVP